MKKLLVSQRTYLYNQDYTQERDCLDKQWMDFLAHLLLLPVLVPNSLKMLERYLQEDVAGILLTGGNDDPVRMDIELQLIAHAEKNKIPLMGVCHGMQMIQRYYDIKLSKYPYKPIQRELLKCHEQLKIKNSYHTLATKQTISDLEVWAEKEGWIKAISHKIHPIHGIMWHPERETPFHEDDLCLFKEVFLC